MGESFILVRRMICRPWTLQSKNMFLLNEHFCLGHQSFWSLATVRANSVRRQLITYDHFQKQTLIAVTSTRCLKTSSVRWLPPEFQMEDHGRRILFGR